MKKAMALILALTLALSISVTAFAAEENQTTVTADVSSHDPSYVIHIPQATTITVDRIEPQQLTDEVYVDTLQYWEDNLKVTCTPSGTDLECGNVTIKTNYLYKTKTMASPAALATFDCGVGAGNGTAIFAQVTKEEWDKAKNGTYTATVTFAFDVEKKTAEETKPETETTPDEDTIGWVLNKADGGFPTTEGSGWKSDIGSHSAWKDADSLHLGNSALSLSTVLTGGESGRYVCSKEDFTFAFVVTEEKLCEIILKPSSGTSITFTPVS